MGLPFKSFIASTVGILTFFVLRGHFHHEEPEPEPEPVYKWPFYRKG